MSYKVRSKLSLILTEVKCSLLYMAVWAMLVPFLVLLYFAFLKSTVNRTGGIPCKADYLNSLCNGDIIQFLLIPLAVILIGLIAEQNNTFNFIIRVQKRSALISKQLIKTVAFAAVFSLYFAGASVVLSGLFASKNINWNEITSNFFVASGYTLDTRFSEVLSIIFLKTFISYLLFSSLTLTLNIVLHKVFSFIIMLVICAAEPLGFIKYVIKDLFNIAEELSYISTPEIIIQFVMFPLITVLLAMLSFKLIKRKDLLSQ
jgi:hypothetical protein